MHKYKILREMLTLHIEMIELYLQAEEATQKFAEDALVKQRQALLDVLQAWE